MLDPDMAGRKPADLEAIRERVGSELDFSHERFSNVLADSRDDLTEAEAKEILERVKVVWQEASGEIEMELRALFDPRGFRNVLALHLGMLGVRGLVDDELADFLELSKEQRISIREKIASDKRKNPRSPKLQSPPPPVQKSLVSDVPIDKIDLEDLLNKIAASQQTKEEDASPAVHPLERERMLNLERDQRLWKDVQPLLDATQQLQYQRAKDRAVRFLELKMGRAR